MSNSNQPNQPLIHLICDFRVESPDYTVAMARMATEFAALKTLITPQPFKKGHILGQSVFLKLVLNEFPEGTVHICRFGTMSRLPNRFVVAKHKGKYFMGPDSGLLPLYFGEEEIIYYNITPAENVTIFDPLKEVYIPALKQLLSTNMDLEAAGFPIKEMMVRSSPPQPTLSNGMMRLTVIYNDYYGNAYLNINKQMFEEVGQGRPFRLMLNSTMEISRLSQSYNDVPEGMELCMFGHGDIMQIAVNAGSAAQYLSLNEDKPVVLFFKE
jgi:S-adenosylmethionine hydrolase